MTQPRPTAVAAPHPASNLVVAVQTTGAAGSVLALFPREDSPGIALSRDAFFNLSGPFSGLYRGLIDAVSPELSRRFGLDDRASRALARNALVPLANLFFDRLIRLQILIGRHPGKAISVALPAGDPAVHQSCSIHAEAASSEPLNQWALTWAARALEIPLSAPVGAGQKTAPTAAAFVNHNFTGRSLLDRGIGRLARTGASILGKVSPSFRGKVATLFWGYNHGALSGKGFFGWRGMADLNGSNHPPRTQTDPALREEILGENLKLAALPASELLRAAGMPELADRPSIMEAFIGYLREGYPAPFLEAIPERLDSFIERLRPLRSKPLILESMGGYYSTYLVAAARTLGMEIIGCQHGGGYGYLNNQSYFEELEFPLCDRFITWGWNRFPEETGNPMPKAVPLPSPWLSQRSRFWRSPAKALASGRTQAPHDILFMSDKLRPFLPAPVGSEACRIDCVAEVSSQLQLFAAAAAEGKVSILHKPFDAETHGLLRGTVERMEKIGGPYYRCVDRMNKGLSRELLKSCRLVVWDKPGTGFLECLAAGIPTMVFWLRLYNKESPWALELFDELQTAGLAHKGPQSLIGEAVSFKKSPRDWMKDPRRVEAGARFCRAFARQSADWPKSWSKFLASL